ncbi:MAG: hypothetical protein LBF88_06580 [Planctomycetaceae bacterium]|jgi:hypothetical protein|nr:hypothetical protein [Planctomycetaceae bacterium]
MKSFLVILCFLLFLLSFLLFCGARTLALKLAQSSATLVYIVEFHKFHVDKNECETWDQYLEDIKLYADSSNNSKKERLQVYLKSCEQQTRPSKEVNNP